MGEKTFPTDHLHLLSLFMFVCSSQGTDSVCDSPLVSQVLSCILDPLLQLCTVSASNLGTADMATYMVNSLYVMKTTLALFEFTDKRLEMLEFQVSASILYVCYV